MEDALEKKNYKLGGIIYNDNNTIYDITKNEVKYVLKVSKTSSLEYNPYEYLILKFLDHPNIIKIHDIITFTKDDSIFLGLIYKKLTVLIDYIDIPWKIFERWLTQAIDICWYLQNNNIIHNDIKPNNIFIDNKDNLILGDFGIARIGEFVNKLNYSKKYQTAAPEYYTDKKISYSANTYAFAIVFLRTLERVKFSYHVKIKVFADILTQWITDRDEPIETLIHKLDVKVTPFSKRMLTGGKLKDFELEFIHKTIDHLDIIISGDVINKIINFILTSQYLVTPSTWKQDYYMLIMIGHLYFTSTEVRCCDGSMYEKKHNLEYSHSQIIDFMIKVRCIVYEPNP